MSFNLFRRSPKRKPDKTNGKPVLTVASDENQQFSIIPQVTGEGMQTAPIPVIVESHDEVDTPLEEVIMPALAPEESADAQVLEQTTEPQKPEIADASAPEPTPLFAEIFSSTHGVAAEEPVHEQEPEAGLDKSPLPEAAVPRPKKKENNMSASIQSSIRDLLEIEGAVGAAIVDIASGMELGTGGSPNFDLGVAAAGNSNVIRAKLATMAELGIDERIEDIMITLGSQYHLLSVLNSSATDGLFIYMVLDRRQANLALARHKLNKIASQISV